MSVLVVGYRKSLAEFLHMVFGTWSGETDADFIPISFPRCTFFESTTRPPFLPNASWKIAMKCPDPWEMMWEDRRHCDASKKKGRKKSLGDLLLEDWKTIYLQIYTYIYISVCVSNAFMSTWFETQILGISTHHQSLRTSMNQLHPPRPSQWEQLEALLHSKGGDLSRSFC